nr:hypothetical protein Iba_scaffold14897CG0560 [Ipomoea batatas]
MEGLGEIALIHLIFGSLPQCQCLQTLVSLSLNISTISAKAEEGHHFRSPSSGGAVLDKDGIGHDGDGFVFAATEMGLEWGREGEEKGVRVRELR